METADSFFQEALALLLAVPPVQHKPSKKNAHREREKAEKRELRRRAFALEGELLHLQLRHLQPDEAPNDLREGWRRAALRAREALALAENQNHFLRAQCARQGAAIERLLAALGSDELGLAYRSSRLMTPVPRAQAPALRRRAAAFDDQILQELHLAELDGVYRMAAQVFKDSLLDLNSHEPSLPTVRSRRLRGTEIQVFEATETRVLQFEFSRVECEAWQIISSLYPSRLGEDTFMGKVFVGTSDYELRINFTMRRYREQANGKMIIVWRTLTIGDGAFAGMDADETGWMMVHPQRAKFPEEDSGATVMQICMRIIPMFAEPPSLTKTRQFTETLMQCGDNGLMNMAQIMESVLLQATAAVEEL